MNTLLTDVVCSIPCLILLRLVIAIRPARRRKRKRRRKSRRVSHPHRRMVRMPNWHAMLAAEERDPGTWTMVDPDGREYGLVEIRRLDGQIVYRVTAMGRPAGYTGTLREACARIHHAFIAAHSSHRGACNPPPRPTLIYPVGRRMYRVGHE